MESWTIDNAYDDLIRLGIAPPNQIIGCSDDEIAEVMSDQGVTTLPTFYRDFLRVMGKRAGKLFPDSEIYYPDILGLKTFANGQLLSDPLPDETFIFSMYSEEQFMYFYINEDPNDPAVHFYHDEWSRFVWQQYKHFSDFLIECINGISPKRDHA
jgi:hypothetical protein